MGSREEIFKKLLDLLLENENIELEEFGINGDEGYVNIKYNLKDEKVKKLIEDLIKSSRS